MMPSRTPTLVALLLAVLFAGGSYVVPLLEPSLPRLAGALDLIYAPVCHQLPERSISVGQGVQAVCARCSGLYLGGVSGLLVGWLVFAGKARYPRPL